MKLKDIRIRDPFIFPENGIYYLFGTTDDTCWSGEGKSFLCYKSRDLVEFEGPYTAFERFDGFWADRNFWAPEVHRYRDKYYMFASFKSAKSRRGTQILKAKRPEGPYRPVNGRPYTPQVWDCLDGTFFVEEDTPYSMFSHEWTQIGDGEFCVCPLFTDMTGKAGIPVTVLRASSAPWVRKYNGGYIADGCFLHRLKNGNLLLLWSSMSDEGYALGQAVSRNGIYGPYDPDFEPIMTKDAGHGMLFYTFYGQLMLILHQPNQTPDERAVLYEVGEDGDRLRIIREFGKEKTNGVRMDYLREGSGWTSKTGG